MHNFEPSKVYWLSWVMQIFSSQSHREYPKIRLITTPIHTRFLRALFKRLFENHALIKELWPPKLSLSLSQSPGSSFAGYYSYCATARSRGGIILTLYSQRRFASTFLALYPPRTALSNPRDNCVGISLAAAQQRNPTPVTETRPHRVDTPRQSVNINIFRKPGRKRDKILIRVKLFGPLIWLFVIFKYFFSENFNTSIYVSENICLIIKILKFKNIHSNLLLNFWLKKFWKFDFFLLIRDIVTTKMYSEISIIQNSSVLN